MLQYQLPVVQPLLMCNIDLLILLAMCVTCDLYTQLDLQLQVYLLIGATTGSANCTAEWQQTNTSAAGCSRQSSQTAGRLAGAA